jgi:hypothetical protein
MEKIKEITELYFRCFQNKDINILQNLYYENVILKDWAINVVGVDEVIKSNKELFQLKYDLVVHNISVFNNMSFNMITIYFENEYIDVLDVIYFSDDYKIIKVRAYKG